MLSANKCNTASDLRVNKLLCDCAKRAVASSAAARKIGVLKKRRSVQAVAAGVLLELPDNESPVFEAAAAVDDVNSGAKCLDLDAKAWLPRFRDVVAEAV